MRKGFSMAEMLITLVLVAVMTVLTLPMIIANLGDQNKTLYKSAFNLVQSVVNDLTYYGGLDSTFCSKFTASVNTLGTVKCSVDSSVVPNEPNFITSNSMRWYGFEDAFGSCPAGIAGNCITIQVDIDGIKRSINSAGSDILGIIITSSGKVYAPPGKEAKYIYGNENPDYTALGTETGGTETGGTETGGTTPCSQNCYDSSTGICKNNLNGECSDPYTCSSCTLSTSCTQNCNNSSTGQCQPALEGDICPSGYSCIATCPSTCTQNCYNSGNGLCKAPVGGACSSGYNCQACTLSISCALSCYNSALGVCMPNTEGYCSASATCSNCGSSSSSTSSSSGGGCDFCYNLKNDTCVPSVAGSCGATEDCVSSCPSSSSSGGGSSCGICKGTHPTLGVCIETTPVNGTCPSGYSCSTTDCDGIVVGQQ